jgi:hypothetical protein
LGGVLVWPATNEQSTATEQRSANNRATIVEEQPRRTGSANNNKNKNKTRGEGRNKRGDTKMKTNP